VEEDSTEGEMEVKDGRGRTLRCGAGDRTCDRSHIRTVCARGTALLFFILCNFMHFFGTHCLSVVVQTVFHCMRKTLHFECFSCVATNSKDAPVLVYNVVGQCEHRAPISYCTFFQI
jgi:hypothetical protein